MFPPDSPQSPLDGPLLINNQNNDNNTVQLRKPSDTLRNNIDMKEEIARKRTSLKIDNQDNTQSKNTNDNNQKSQRNDNDNINHHHHQDNHRNDNDNIECNNHNDNDNNNKRHRISMTSSSNDDDEADYNDLENGNTTDSQSHRTRDSIVSSEDLDVDAMNTINDRMSKDIGTTAFNDHGLLSPDEGPLSRRYAEIAHFKNW